MWTETPTGRETVMAVSKELVAQTAPEELDMFDELMGEYFNNPQPPEQATGSEDDPLAFGLAQTFVAVTPAAGAIVTTVLTFILTEVIKTTQQESAKAISAKIKKLFNPQKKTEALTPAQLKQVHHLTMEQAKAFGLDAKQAKTMADALAGSLTLAN